MLSHSSDTIVAQSTARGIGAIAVIRVSGSQAIASVDAIFSRPAALCTAQAKTVLHGYIMEDGKPVDEVLLCKFEQPNSYTGEDLVEISCHGSPFICEKIIQLIVAQGCRIAEPGEFSRRAFINGKIDLLQAEAIADLIQSQTARSLSQALEHLQGQLSKRLQALRRQLLQQCSLLEIELDFSEEEIFVNRTQLLADLHQVHSELSAMLDSFSYGRILREGALIAVIGKPNVGKSSLMNALLRMDRAIVSDMAGTTRDSLEESLNIDGFLFRISDTAGLRNSADPVERLGIDRARQIMARADIILLVVDGSAALSEEDEQILQSCGDVDKSYLIVLNKQDLGLQPFSAANVFGYPVVAVSCHSGFGLHELEQRLKECVLLRKHEQQEVVIDKVRHWHILSAANTDLEHALESLQNNRSPEFVALDLKSALYHIGELTGEVTSQEILNTIFAHYCIGK